MWALGTHSLCFDWNKLTIDYNDLVCLPRILVRLSINNLADSSSSEYTPDPDFSPTSLRANLTILGDECSL